MPRSAWTPRWTGRAPDVTATAPRPRERRHPCPGRVSSCGRRHAPTLRGGRPQLLTRQRGARRVAAYGEPRHPFGDAAARGRGALAPPPGGEVGASAPETLVPASGQVRLDAGARTPRSGGPYGDRGPPRYECALRRRRPGVCRRAARRWSVGRVHDAPRGVGMAGPAGGWTRGSDVPT